MWLRYQKTQNSRTTHRSYRSISRKLCRFLRTAGVPKLCELSRETMMKYRAWCLKLNNSKVTVDNNLIALRSFFSWSVSKGWITVNPLSQSRYGERIFFDEKSKRKDPYTRDEFSSITTMADGDDRSLFTLLGRWGLRISELAMLEWVDIDDVGGWLHIRNKRTHDGIDYKPKDKTDRKMPLEGRAVAKILEVFADRSGRAGYVLPLPQVKHREDYAERHFLKKLKELAEPTGIDPKRLTLHQFRHFFVCECADQGIPMATVMAWVGHDEMKMIMYYYSLRDQSARDAMRKLTADWTASRASQSSWSSDERIDQRAGRTARRRTSTNALEHLGSEPRETAFPDQKRGKTERGGFEPPVPV
ncbi:MAG: tyrosine-type recombinase/integrase [Phycisphaerae bacterium]